MNTTEPLEIVANQLYTLIRHHYRPFGLEGSTTTDAVKGIALFSPQADDNPMIDTWTVSIIGPKRWGLLILVGEPGVRVGHQPPTGFTDLEAVWEWSGLIHWEHPQQSELVAAAITEHAAHLDGPPFPSNWMEEVWS